MLTVEEDLWYRAPPGPLLHLVPPLWILGEVNVAIGDVIVPQQCLGLLTELTTWNRENDNSSNERHIGDVT